MRPQPRWIILSGNFDDLSDGMQVTLYTSRQKAQELINRTTSDPEYRKHTACRSR